MGTLLAVLCIKNGQQKLIPIAFGLGIFVDLSIMVKILTGLAQYVKN